MIGFILFASASFFGEPLLVGILTFLLVYEAHLHLAICVAIAAAAFVLTVLLQSHTITFWISSVLFSILYAYLLYRSALEGFGEAYDTTWQIVSVALTFFISMVLHAGKKYIAENAQPVINV